MMRHRSMLAAALPAMVLAAALPASSEPGARSVGAPRGLSVRTAPAETAASMVPDEVLVRYRPGTSGAERASARSRARARSARVLRVPGWDLITLPAGDRVRDAIARLEGDPRVERATPNYRARPSAAPTDTYFDTQWGLHNTGQDYAPDFSGTIDADIDAPEAWTISTGSEAVVVAVVDTGVAYDHPDLAPNMWTNAGEIGGGKETNEVDDDGNGYVDDWRGWDFYAGDADPYDEDGDGHGTHVAGIVGARGDDGHGVAGVSWDVAIMPLRVLGADGGTMAGIAEAFTYAAGNGAKVVNASLGASGDDDDIVRDAIVAAPGTLFVVAAGNDGTNNDTAPVYPCNTSASNLLCVAAADEDDGRASFSNYGATSVDLAAPGVNISSSYLPSAAATSGSSSLSDSPAGYGNGTASTVQTVTAIDLTGETGCQLDYQMRLDALEGDVLDVRRSLDGVAWSSIEGGGWWGSTGGDFLAFSAPLAADGHPTVWLQFAMTSDASGSDDGVYLDDLEVVCDSGAVWSEGFETDLPGRWVSGGVNDGWGRSGVAGEWMYMSGTSMASPFVAGTAALVWAVHPSSSMAHVRNVLLGSVDKKAAWSGKLSTAGRLNAHRAVQYAPDVTAPASHKVYGSLMSLIYQKTKTFKLYWSATDSGSGLRSYDVRYKRARYDSSFGSYVTWKSATSTTNASAGSYGYTYCFDVRARDKALNLSSYSADNCTSVPVNNTTLAHSSGWIKKTSTSGYFANTYSSSSKKGATLKLGSVRVKRLAIVATKCNGCGKIGVYRGSTLLKTFDLQSSSYKRRQFLSVKSYSSPQGPATITIKILSSGKPVRIEGLGVSLA